MEDIRIEFNLLDKQGCNDFMREFKGYNNVTVRRRNICQSRADCIVTAANSYGYMDGGVDSAINNLLSSYNFDERIDAKVRRVIRDAHYGEQPVGTCLLVRTDHPFIRYLAHTPTMRLPEDVSKTINAYLAFRATLVEILNHNSYNTTKICSVLTTAFCTGAGSMDYTKSARQMRIAYDSLVEQHSDYDWKSAWRRHKELLST